MYILIREDATKVLGFTVWTGFTQNGHIEESFNDVAVTSFDKNEKAVSVRLFSTPEYASTEAVRISKIIKETHDKEIKLDSMPLHVYLRQIENWS
jgi:hypothetical protein